MERFKTPEGDLFCSEEFARPARGLVEISNYTFEDELKNILDTVFKNRPKFREYCELYTEIKGLKPFAVLNAHGESNDEWVYIDGEREKSVQCWVDKQDGNYGTLVLYICNPGCPPSPEKYTPQTRTSLLYAAHRIVGGFRSGGFDLIVPDEGIIDPYSIESKLEDLRAK